MRTPCPENHSCSAFLSASILVLYLQPHDKPSVPKSCARSYWCGPSQPASFVVLISFGILQYETKFEKLL